MNPEDELVPISALQHYAFCPRQCGLIHVETVWADNVHTAQGRVLHQRTHEASGESRRDVRVARGLRLRSLALGIAGVADVVEFHRVRQKPDSPGDLSHACPLPGRAGLWTPLPVEYKKGKPKRNPCDRIQLCAQAICLEEMLHCIVPSGALFYGKTRRRTDVSFDVPLRRRTVETARQVRQMIRDNDLPPACPATRCRACSLKDLCLPEKTASPRSPTAYLRNRIQAAIAYTGEEPK